VKLPIRALSHSRQPLRVHFRSNNRNRLVTTSRGLRSFRQDSRPTAQEATARSTYSPRSLPVSITRQVPLKYFAKRRYHHRINRRGVNDHPVIVDKQPLKQRGKGGVCENHCWLRAMTPSWDEIQIVHPGWPDRLLQEANSLRKSLRPRGSDSPSRSLECSWGALDPRPPGSSSSRFGQTRLHNGWR
jgi:hypothetical protein